MFLAGGYYGYLLAHSTLNTKKKARLKNDLVFNQIFFRLYEIAMDSRYDITGLPSSISKRMLKNALLFNGSAAIYKTKNGTIIALPCATGDEITVNGDPGGGYVYGVDGTNEHIELYIPGTDIMEQDSSPLHGVLIRENNSQFPFIETVYYYASIIADCMRSIDVARKQVKIPALVACDPKTLPSVKKLFDDRDDNEEVIAVSTLFPMDKITTLPFAGNAASQIPALTALCDWEENKFRSLCGIMANEAVDKKGENLLTDEISVNEENTNATTERLISNLNLSFDNVNQVFGLNIRAVDPNNKVNEVKRNE